jgi:hypothetical protein
MMMSVVIASSSRGGSSCSGAASGAACLLRSRIGSRLQAVLQDLGNPNQLGRFRAAQDPVDDREEVRQRNNQRGENQIVGNQPPDRMLRFQRDDVDEPLEESHAHKTSRPM